jgi:hypothetical protein
LIGGRTGNVAKYYVRPGKGGKRSAGSVGSSLDK